MNYTIPLPDGRTVLKKKDGMTSDIIREVIEANNENLEVQTKSLSYNFSRDRAGMELLWRFVKGEIGYEEDPTGVQWVREPARLFADGVGDCKSFTLLICAVLKNLGITHTIRFCTYNPANQYVTHVYPIAHMPDGQTIIIDAVWNAFDEEKTPLFLTTDYFFDMDVYRLSGVGSNPEAIIQNVAAHMTREGNKLTTYATDITTMSEREVIAFLSGGTVSGIGSNAAAFNLPVIIMPDDAVGKIDLKKTGQKIKDALKKTGKAIIAPAVAIKDAVKKMVNWVFQTGLKKAAPYFLFSFITKTDGLSPQVKQKIDKQRKIIAWIAKTTGTSEGVVLAAISKGIQDKYKQSPDQVIANARNIAGIGVIDIAIELAIELVKKVIDFFKKSDAPEVSADAASDINDLRRESPPIQPPPQVLIDNSTKTVKPDMGKDTGEDNKPYDPELDPSRTTNTGQRPIIIRTNEPAEPTAPTNPGVLNNGTILLALLAAYILLGE